MLRDRIVVGNKDSAPSEKLQMDPDLTLEKAVRQKEAVKEQHLQLQDDSSKHSSITVEQVRGDGQSNRPQPIKGRTLWQTKAPKRRQMSSQRCPI